MLTTVDGGLVVVVVCGTVVVVVVVVGESVVVVVVGAEVVVEGSVVDVVVDVGADAVVEVVEDVGAEAATTDVVSVVDEPQAAAMRPSAAMRSSKACDLLSVMCVILAQPPIHRKCPSPLCGGIVNTTCHTLGRHCSCANSSSSDS